LGASRGLLCDSTAVLFVMKFQWICKLEGDTWSRAQCLATPLPNPIPHPKPNRKRLFSPLRRLRCAICVAPNTDSRVPFPCPVPQPPGVLRERRKRSPGRKCVFVHFQLEKTYLFSFCVPRNSAAYWQNHGPRPDTWCFGGGERASDPPAPCLRHCMFEPKANATKPLAAWADTDTPSRSSYSTQASYTMEVAP